MSRHPRRRSSSTTNEPRKPAPPVTQIRLVVRSIALVPGRHLLQHTGGPLGEVLDFRLHHDSHQLGEGNAGCPAQFPSRLGGIGLERVHQSPSREASALSARYSTASLPSTCLAWPTIGMCAGTFLDISAGSMSMWMNFAFGANSDSLPVIRSSNLAPTAQIRSASSIA